MCGLHKGNHLGSQLVDVGDVDIRAAFAKSQKSIPHERVQLQSFDPTINSLAHILVRLKKSSLEGVDSGRVWQMVSFAFGMLIPRTLVHP